MSHTPRHGLPPGAVGTPQQAVVMPGSLAAMGVAGAPNMGQVRPFMTPPTGVRPGAFPAGMHTPYAGVPPMQRMPAGVSPQDMQRMIAMQQQQQRAAAAKALPRGKAPMPVTPAPATQAPAAAKAPSTTTQAERKRRAEAESLRRKRLKRATDKTLSTKLQPVVPESRVYTDLLSFEQRLDAILMRKRMDMQESLKGPAKHKRVLRVFVYNTTSGQADDAVDVADDGAPEPPAWSLRIEGRLLDDPSKAKSRRKFLSFVQRIVVEFDPVLMPANNIVEWHRPPGFADSDGFEIKRLGDRPLRCKILLHLDHPTPVFRLSYALMELLGIHTETCAGVLAAIWGYAKKNKLQDAEDRKTIMCDAALQRLFGMDRIAFSLLPSLINAHLAPPEPVEINYTIRIGEEVKKDVCYDIDVEVEDTPKSGTFGLSGTLAKEIVTLDESIQDLIDKINEHKLKREFMLDFAENPRLFIDKWLESQTRDLKVMTNTLGDPEAERRSDFYQKAWAQEGVYRYISAKIQQRRLQLEQELYGSVK
eukprot:Opistho-1_new@19665